MIWKVQPSTKLVLGLHTTTPILQIGLGVLCADRQLGSIFDWSWDLGKESGRLVHNYLQEAMCDRSWQDLAYVCVAAGVGSFTGTRVGVVLARTLGQQLGIPVYAINCLEITDHSQAHSSSFVCSLMMLAHERWQKTDYSDWRLALPIYGS